MTSLVRCGRFWTSWELLRTALTRGFTFPSLVGNVAYLNCDKEKAWGIVGNYSSTGVCLACVAGLGCTCWLSKVNLIIQVNLNI